MKPTALVFFVSLPLVAQDAASTTALREPVVRYFDTVVRDARTTAAVFVEEGGEQCGAWSAGHFYPGVVDVVRGSVVRSTSGSGVAFVAEGRAGAFVCHGGMKYGPFEEVGNVSVSDDGDHVAFSCRDTDTENHKLCVDGRMSELAPDFRMSMYPGIRFTPGGEAIFLGGAGRKARGGELSIMTSSARTDGYQAGAAWWFSLSPDGSRVASHWMSRGKRAVRVWSVPGMELLHEWRTDGNLGIVPYPGDRHARRTLKLRAPQILFNSDGNAFWRVIGRRGGDKVFRDGEVVAQRRQLLGLSNDGLPILMADRSGNRKQIAIDKKIGCLLNVGRFLGVGPDNVTYAYRENRDQQVCLTIDTVAAVDANPAKPVRSYSYDYIGDVVWTDSCKALCLAFEDSTKRRASLLKHGDVVAEVEAAAWISPESKTKRLNVIRDLRAQSGWIGLVERHDHRLHLVSRSLKTGDVEHLLEINEAEPLACTPVAVSADGEHLANMVLIGKKGSRELDSPAGRGWYVCIDGRIVAGPFDLPSGQSWLYFDGDRVVVEGFARSGADRARGQGGFVVKIPVDAPDMPDQRALVVEADSGESRKVDDTKDSARSQGSSTSVAAVEKPLKEDWPDTMIAGRPIRSYYWRIAAASDAFDTAVKPARGRLAQIAFEDFSAKLADAKAACTQLAAHSSVPAPGRRILHDALERHWELLPYVAKVLMTDPDPVKGIKERTLAGKWKYKSYLINLLVFLEHSRVAQRIDAETLLALRDDADRSPHPLTALMLARICSHAGIVAQPMAPWLCSLVRRGMRFPRVPQIQNLVGNEAPVWCVLNLNSLANAYGLNVIDLGLGRARRQSHHIEPPAHAALKALAVICDESDATIKLLESSAEDVDPGHSRLAKQALMFLRLRRESFAVDEESIKAWESEGVRRAPARRLVARGHKPEDVVEKTPQYVGPGVQLGEVERVKVRVVDIAGDGGLVYKSKSMPLGRERVGAEVHMLAYDKDGNVLASTWHNGSYPALIENDKQRNGGGAMNWGPLLDGMVAGGTRFVFLEGADPKIDRDFFLGATVLEFYVRSVSVMSGF